MAIVRVYGKGGQEEGWRRVERTLQRPLTVADVSRHVSQVGTPCCVQVRVKGEVLCGRVSEVGSPSSVRDFFKVETQIGTQWVSGWNARLCVGDGRCQCGDAPPPASSVSEPLSASASLSPPGNTGVTL